MCVCKTRVVLDNDEKCFHSTAQHVQTAYP